MQIHSLVCMPHAQTAEQKSNVDRAETWVLPELKKKYPRHSHWPGIPQKWRLFFQRSEWVENINEGVIEKLFSEVQSSGLFGPCLHIKNGKNVDIPKVWDAWRVKVYSEAQENREREWGFAYKTVYCHWVKTRKGNRSKETVSTPKNPVKYCYSGQKGVFEST